MDRVCPPARLANGRGCWRRGTGCVRRAVVRQAIIVALAVCGLSNFATMVEIGDFLFSGAQNWFEQFDITYDGGTAWQSGSIGNSQYSSMDKTIDFSVDGTLSFYWRVSSESNYDRLKFYIDGIEQNSISGDTNWEQMTYSISAGSHTIKWDYSKDSSVSRGSDCGWVDQIIWSDGYRVSFNARGGTCSVGNVDVGRGNSIGSLPVPEREGCRFLGWYTQRVGGERVTASTSVTSNTTYWAHWQPTYEWRYTTDAATGLARLDGVEPALEGVVTLPNVLGGYRVVSIADNAFMGQGDLMELTVPDNVTNIGSRAFADCSEMTCLKVRSSVVHVSWDAFTGCSAVRDVMTSGWFGGYIPSQNVTNAVVVPGAVAIDGDAFRNRGELTRVAIPDSVRRVGLGAFENCNEALYDKTSRPGLVLVDGWVVGYDPAVMGDSFALDLTGVRGVADGALANCVSLVHVTFPDGLVSIGPGTFRGCSQLVDVELPQSLREIGESAFLNCGALQRLVVPAGVTNVAANAFCECTGLENVAVLPTNCVFGAGVFGQCFAIREATVSQPTLDSTLSVVFPASFQNITNVTLAAAVTNISDGAFANCTGLLALAVPGGVMRIGHDAFSGCAALTNISNAADVGMIGRRAFQNSGLRTFTMPVSVTNVLERAFLGCVDLLRVDVDDMTSWCRIRFADRFANPVGRQFGPDRHCDLYCDGQIVLDLEVPADVGELGPFTFVENTNLVSVIVRPGLTEIGVSAFSSCDRLATVELPEGVLTIGENAFSGCSELDNLILPASVTMIDDWAFLNCTSLSRLTLLETREGIENSSRIGVSAFENCTALTTVAIPSRVTTFGSAVFRNCDHMRSVCYLGDFAPVLETGATDIYEGTPTVMLTYVKQGSTGWVDGSSDLPTVWPNNPNFGRGIRPMPQIVCEVTFDGNGTSSPTKLERDAGQLLGELPEPVRRGYAFDGWFTAVNGGAKVVDNSVVTADVMLYAHWTLLPVYDISFNANGGSGTTVVGIIEGETIGSFPEVSRYGYSVDGWWTAATGGRQVTVDMVISNTATYWAHWKKNVYDVTFDANGATGTETRKVEHGKAVGTLPELSQEGFSFDGWWTEAVGGTQVSSAMTVYGPMTFWAHWTANSYVVTFDPADGSAVARYTISHGATLNFLPTPERKDFLFDGWWTAADGGVLVGPDTVVTGPITFWAHWKEANTQPDLPVIQPDLPVIQPDLPVIGLYRTAEGAVLGVAASTYDGYLYDANGNVKGTIQVKVGKPNVRTGLAAVKATVVGLDGKKKNLKASGNGKVAIDVDGPTTVSLAGGDACEVTLGAKGLSGTYGSYTIDGALNVFVSKDGADLAAATTALRKWQGAVNVAWGDAQGWNGLSVTIAAKGKATVSGTLAKGTKVSVKSQLIVGEEWYCVPVVVSKKAQLAFNVWLPKTATSTTLPEVEGIVGAVVGKPGALKGGATFRLGASVGDAKYNAYLPNGLAVGGGAKWTLPKAGKVQLAKDGTVDTSKLGENPSALKLTYKAKDGSFKGSFKAYADVGGKPKATTVKVAGVLVNGVGYGTVIGQGVRAPVTVE